MTGADDAALIDDAKAAEVGRSFLRLVDIMAKLRDPVSGCPWDVKQTFATIAPYTIEEAYEVADAIQQDDMPALVDELGDLLLQVVFHSRIAEEMNAFDIGSVCNAISDKMVRRHPHVFGDEDGIINAEAQTVAWEELKALERAASAAVSGKDMGVLDGVAKGLPALMRSLKLQKRAARVGFDWPDIGQILAKVHEELGEFEAEVQSGVKGLGSKTRMTDELGDVLFTLVNVARKLDLDADAALRSTIAKFERRFQAVEASYRVDGLEMSDAALEDMECRWQDAKRTDPEL